MEGMEPPIVLEVLVGPGVMVPVGAALVLVEESLPVIIVLVVVAVAASEMPKSVGGRLIETSTTDAGVRLREKVSASREANQPVADTTELAAEDEEESETVDKVELEPGADTAGLVAEDEEESETVDTIALEVVGSLFHKRRALSLCRFCCWPPSCSSAS